MARKDIVTSMKSVRVTFVGGLWRAERRSQETVSAMVQFARESNESGPDVVVYGMVPSSLVSRKGRLRRLVPWRG